MRTPEELRELFDKVAAKEPTGLCHAQQAIVWSQMARDLEQAEIQLSAMLETIREQRRHAEQQSSLCMAGAMSWALAEQLRPAKENPNA